MGDGTAEMHQNQYQTLHLLGVVFDCLCKLAETGRWSHVCWISCDVAKIELTWWCITGFPRTRYYLCGPVRRPEYFLVSSIKKMWKHITTFPGQLLILFTVMVRNCMSPIPPPSDKTNVVYPLQPLDANTFNLHFFFFSFSGKFSTSGLTWRWKPGYWDTFDMSIWEEAQRKRLHRGNDLRNNLKCHIQSRLIWFPHRQWSQPSPTSW